MPLDDDDDDNNEVYDYDGQTEKFSYLAIYPPIHLSSPTPLLPGWLYF